MTRWRSAACVVALMALALALVIGHVQDYDTISPIDESQHLDYLINAGDGHLVGLGDLIGQRTMRAETCHRLDAEFDVKIPPCVTDAGTVLDPATFQESGYNTAAIHPPTYYVVDGVLARVIAAVVPFAGDDVVTNGRIAGAVWLMAAVGAMWLLLREVGAGRVLSSSIIAIAITAPTVLFAAATINNDGTALLCGALLVWAVLRWERGRLSLGVVLLASALCAATKVTNLIAVAVVMIYLLLRSDRSPLGRVRTAGWSEPVRTFVRRERRRLLALGGLIAAAVGVALVWQVVAMALATVPGSDIPMTQRYTVDTFPVGPLVGAWRQTIDPLFGPYLAPFMRNDLITLISGVTAAALVILAVVALARNPRGSRARTLAVAGLTAGLIAGPAIVLFNYLAQRVYVDIPFRYALVIVPTLLAAGASVLRSRPATVATALWAALSVAAVGMAIL
ncbi:MAG: hypothetical protein KGR18_03870 [Acidobacteria bacterium]|nr:hypothetical protein [Acidobacteriota bacterium]